MAGDSLGIGASATAAGTWVRLGQGFLVIGPELFFVCFTSQLGPCLTAPALPPPCFWHPGVHGHASTGTSAGPVGSVSARLKDSRQAAHGSPCPELLEPMPLEVFPQSLLALQELCPRPGSEELTVAGYRGKRLRDGAVEEPANQTFPIHPCQVRLTAKCRQGQSQLQHGQCWLCTIAQRCNIAPGASPIPASRAWMDTGTAQEMMGMSQLWEQHGLLH